MAEPSLKDPVHDRRIDYIEIASTNIAATKRFYIAAFGWRFTDHGPDYTSFDDGRMRKRLIEVRPDDGTERVVTTSDWTKVGPIAWLPSTIPT